jgi:S1-C subfamily serine protease
MLRKFFAIAALSLLPTIASAWDTKTMNQTIDDTNFSVNGICSGTLIDAEKQLVLTAAHCVDAQYEIQDREEYTGDGTVTKKRVRVFTPGFVRQFHYEGAQWTVTTDYRTKLEAVDKVKDLAVLKVMGQLSTREPAHLSCITPERGDKVYIVGNPLGLYGSVVDGIVSSNQRTNADLRLTEDQERELIQMSGGTIGGNSGGAVYDNRGDIIGVPVLAHRVNETLGFAVPLKLIHKFLSENNIDISCRWPFRNIR